MLGAIGMSGGVGGICRGIWESRRAVGGEKYGGDVGGYMG